MQKYIVTCLMALSPLVSLGCSEDEAETDEATADEAAANGATDEAETTEDSDDVETTVAAEQPAELGFFVTSTGSGADGGNIGGLTGADSKCQRLAAAVGAGARTWRAYLSTTTENARDRIGDGPWFNAAGAQVATDVASLHADGLSNGDPQHMMDENGDAVPGPQHDIFTGSNDDGELFLDAAGLAHTCNDWSSSSNDAAAVPGPHVGHSDIPGNPMFSPSWNNAHDAPACDPMSIAMVGGAGRLYCFAL